MGCQEDLRFGAPVGRKVGRSDGFIVGFREGFPVGKVEGSSIGWNEGVSEGLIDDGISLVEKTAVWTVVTMVFSLAVSSAADVVDEMVVN